MMGIDELMDLTMYSSMYLLFYMAYFYVEGANFLCLAVTMPISNGSCLVLPLSSEVSSGGWRASAAL